MSSQHFLKNNISAASLLSSIGCNARAINDVPIKGVCGLDEIKAGFLSFSKTKCNIDLRDVCVFAPAEGEFCYFSANPRLDFVRALEWLQANIGFQPRIKKSNISKTAKIASDAKIEQGVHIGDNVIISSGVVIKSDTIIGANCVIGENTVIGGSGFGFERDETGKAIRFTHLGGVIIQDNVEIGSNSCVDKGTMKNTIIEEGVKIDNLVQIAHNCVIGAHTMIASNSAIGGSVNIGRKCFISTLACIKNGSTIGNNVFVGIGSVVIRNFKENARVFGNPAQKIG